MTTPRTETPQGRDAERRWRLGVLAASLSAVLFGTSYVATAFALRSFSPLGIGMWRGAISAVVVAVWVLAERKTEGASDAAAYSATAATPGAWGRVWRLAVLGVLGGSLFILGMNVAVQLSGAAIASFVAGLYAVLGALFARPLLRERLGPGPVVGFGVALAGTALLGGLEQGGASAGGIAFGLLAAVSYGLYLVLSRRWAGPWRLRPGVVLLSTLLCAAGVLLGVELATEPGAIVPRTVRLDALVAMVWLIAAVSVVAGLLVQASVRLIEARSSSAFLLLNPPTAVVAAWLLLGERLTPAELFGGALVLAGIALAALPGTALGARLAAPRPTVGDQGLK